MLWNVEFILNRIRYPRHKTIGKNVFRRQHNRTGCKHCLNFFHKEECQISRVDSTDKRPLITQATNPNRGGGLGILIGTNLGIVLSLFVFSELKDSPNFLIIFSLALATVVGLLGLADDRWNLRASIRLIVQIFTIGMFVLFNFLNESNQTEISVPNIVLIGIGCTVMGIWWLNLFNFQDGIDGYAASQAIFMLCCVLLFYWLGTENQGNPQLAILIFCTLAATVGFLIFNWAPAKMFMGDCGSTFLGYLIFVIGFLCIKQDWVSLCQWTILSSVFMVDASLTLTFRIIAGENIMTAHRNHAYQKLSRLWKSHRSVTIALIAMNSLVILPLACAAGFWPTFEYVFVITAFILLFLLFMLIKNYPVAG